MYDTEEMHDTEEMYDIEMNDTEKCILYYAVLYIRHQLALQDQTLTEL